MNNILFFFFCFCFCLITYSLLCSVVKNMQFWGGANSKKVNTHPKIPEIDLDFFRLF